MDYKAILKRIEPFFAIGIFVLLLVLATLLWQENRIVKEISEECGWGDEDYYCVCEKSMASQLKNIMEGEVNLSDVVLVR